ncbi:hypothetical protein OMCYN_01603 [cyanobiont of Ornithocercus magnificus]|nr:hypothetical protein OMCYN_01603 [cyanobiont of Ornithocercus magnificus]
MAPIGLMDGYDRRGNNQITVQEVYNHWVRLGAIDLNELQDKMYRYGPRLTTAVLLHTLPVIDPCRRAAFARKQVMNRIGIN